MQILRVLKTSLTCASLAICGFVSADQSGVYLEAGYGRNDIANESVDFNSGLFRIGYRLNDHFAIEGDYAKGSSRRKGGVRYDLDDIWSVGGLAILPLNENIEVFAKVAYAKAELEVRVPGVSIRVKDTDYAYGVGAIGRFNEQHGVRLDYQRLDDVNRYSIAYQYRF